MFTIGLQAQTQWTKDPANPVALNGAHGSWNNHTFNPFVIYNQDSARYEMWFCGDGGSFPYQIGFAVSDDGGSWTLKHAGPVLTPDHGAWDSGGVFSPMVIKEDGQYKMWYAGGTDFQNGIGYATSPDGITWTKYAGNPIVIPGASWERQALGNHFVIHSSIGYQMWYSAGLSSGGYTGGIGYATSADGLIWEKDATRNPVLSLGNSGEWDAVFTWAPRVLILDKLYYMWYGGINMGNVRKVGLATSTDSGKTWTKHLDNPVLSPTPGTWDAQAVQDGFVMLRGDTLHMWYAGIRSYSSSDPWMIGHATSSIFSVGIVEKGAKAPTKYEISQNYPNPFNPATSFVYGIPERSRVTLDIHNVLGQIVATLVDGEQDPGYRSVHWMAPGGIGSGLYFYRLTAASLVEPGKVFVQVRKMLLVK